MIEINLLPGTSGGVDVGEAELVGVKNPNQIRSFPAIRMTYDQE
jgi:hypothetical protein